MKQHIELLGWVDLVSGLFWLVLGLFILVSFLLLAPTTGDTAGSVAVVVIALTVSGLAMAFGIPPLIAGRALLKHKSWARTWAWIAAILAFPIFPVRTLVALYAFWVLTKAQSSDLVGVQV